MRLTLRQQPQKTTTKIKNSFTSIFVCKRAMNNDNKKTSFAAEIDASSHTTAKTLTFSLINIDYKLNFSNELRMIRRRLSGLVISFFFLLYYYFFYIQIASYGISDYIRKSRKVIESSNVFAITVRIVNIISCQIFTLFANQLFLSFFIRYE